jgi:hypothetical protein
MQVRLLMKMESQWWFIMEVNLLKYKSLTYQKAKENQVV